ncbi:zinc ribbon domain-containing protein [Terrilactibacillus sp. S3-3]|nr:zinc ribbon domain-containing protein [Terrilactibacillus sp. S3-3]
MRQVDRFYPSSQICSRCGHSQKMPLHKRTYHCKNCGETLIEI